MKKREREVYMYMCVIESGERIVSRRANDRIKYNNGKRKDREERDLSAGRICNRDVEEIEGKRGREEKAPNVVVHVVRYRALCATATSHPSRPSAAAIWPRINWSCPMISRSHGITAMPRRD